MKIPRTLLEQLTDTRQRNAERIISGEHPFAFVLDTEHVARADTTQLKVFCPWCLDYHAHVVPIGVAVRAPCVGRSKRTPDDATYILGTPEQQQAA